MKFLKVDSLEQARDKLAAALRDGFTQTEQVGLQEAAGRCLAEPVFCPEMVPDFRRSTVDGYAVSARDTQGAGESIPVFLDIVEEVAIGHPAARTLGSGECAYVPTGGMLPEGADAMVMVEYTELFDEKSVAVYSAVSPGNAVVQVGEDARKGELLLERGTRLDAKRIGVLASIGKNQVRVFRPWRLTVISTGDELALPGEEKTACQVYDINTSALCALAQEHGMEVVEAVTLQDEEALLEQALRRSLTECDIVVISGGSSKGKKDMTARLIEKIAVPGVCTHGLALKPGKPTIIGTDEASGTLLIGLPGHPVAAIMVFELLLVWLQRRLYGEKEPLCIPAVLESNIPGAPGRATCQMVKLTVSDSGYRARPVFGKSGLMSTLTQADGYVLLEVNEEGLRSGEQVMVHLV